MRAFLVSDDRRELVEGGAPPGLGVAGARGGYGPSLSVMRVLAPWSWSSTRTTVGSGMPTSGIGSERRTSSSGSTSSRMS